ncbi:DHHW family protein [Paenibacillus sp.]|uniref:DHHW family protein n=1 Tax=Paenibacillus sp. TaxID=58172 RepID=UPI002D229E77|nr:DHHW family protein [Paenibacillus sp.]HZG56087.1 DHHW family protein [Paenibacillus sp.]
MNEKKSQRLNVLLFLLPIFMFFGLSWFAEKGEAVSLREQRTLSAWPAFTLQSVASGEFAAGIESYFADRFSFRERFIAEGNRLKSLRGLPEDDEVTIVATQGNNMHQVQSDDPVEAAPASGPVAESGDGGTSSPTEAEAEPAEEPASALQGNYLVVGNRAMIVYYYTPLAAKQYADTLNAFAAKVGDRYGLSTMIVPSSIEFLENEKYRRLSPPQSVALDYAAEHLSDAVRFVPVRDALERRMQEYVYFRTDHHWTALGAYYAYEAFAETVGLEPMPIEDYVREDLGEFLGTTYAATLSESVGAEPDDLTVYRPNVEYTYKKIVNGKRLDAELIDKEAKGYAAFLGGDSPLSVIETKQKTGKRLLVFKDSFANAFLPFLTPHYEEIHIIDLRHYSGDVYAYMEKESVTDIAFVNSVDVTSHPGYTRILAEKLDLEVEEPNYR